jgi:Fe2+ or Zn2+ uptake regulation protein
MFALSRLKEAGVRLSERRFEVGEVIYTRKETRSAVRVRSPALYFVSICRRNPSG